MKNLIVEFIKLNKGLSRRFDQILPKKFRIDGNRFFMDQFAPSYLKSNAKVYDIGGGKQPYISQDIKKALDLFIVGFDIDQEELNRAPQGSYDKIICADITQFQGYKDADIVICQTLLEHVKNVDQAFTNISSILKTGGLALIFVPSKNAVFARLNILLPQKLKQKILYYIFPETRHAQGFYSYYDKCTPREFRQLAKKNQFCVEKESFHYISSYFSFFFPFYVFWRLWVLGFYLIAREQSAETFCMALRKSDDPFVSSKNLNETHGLTMGVEYLRFSWVPGEN
jgi:2-polyprenyl-3-methyl-5-hydroxy-6-metoxy-1,4-benzoquinol methylase